MDASRAKMRESVSRFVSLVECRAPESPPLTASLGGLLLGVAMLYHVSVVDDSYTNPVIMFDGYIRLATLSPVQTAVLVVTGIGSLAFAGWIRTTTRKFVVFGGIVTGELVSIGYVHLLDNPPVIREYPIVHSYHAAVLASVLFGIALISTASSGTWREPKGLKRHLIGVGPRRFALWGAVGSFLLVVAVGGVMLDVLQYWAHTPFEAFEVYRERRVSAMVVMIGWFVLAALPGYRWDGLLSSWVLVAGPVGGAMATLSVTDQSFLFPFESIEPTWLVIWEFTTRVRMVAVVVGTTGYFLGVAIRQIQSAGVLGEAATHR